MFVVQIVNNKVYAYEFDVRDCRKIAAFINEDGATLFDKLKEGKTITDKTGCVFRKANIRNTEERKAVQKYLQDFLKHGGKSAFKKMQYERILRNLQK